MLNSKEEKYKRYEENYIKKHGRIKIRKMEVARIHGLTLDEYDLLFCDHR